MKPRTRALMHKIDFNQPDWGIVEAFSRDCFNVHVGFSGSKFFLWLHLGRSPALHGSLFFHIQLQPGVFRKAGTVFAIGEDEHGQCAGNGTGQAETAIRGMFCP